MVDVTDFSIGEKQKRNYDDKMYLLSVQEVELTLPERIYNPITAMGFSAMFTFQLDNTNR